MKNVRRIKRMSRGKKKKIPPLNLVSLMDVFTILVFFLLVNSANTEELDNPKTLVLPDSVSERKPEQTVVVMVAADEILIRGKPVVSVADAMANEAKTIPVLQQAMQAEIGRVIGLSDDKSGKSREVTIMGDKGIPFKLLKKVMASCTAAGYSKISLAVVQKASQES